VKFTKAEKSPLLETDDFSLGVTAKETAAEDEKIQRTRLSVDVSVANPNHSQVLPEGLWAFLDFKISADAKPFSIAVRGLSIQVKDASERALSISVEPGKIIVSSADLPLAGCFFFSH